MTGFHMVLVVGQIEVEVGDVAEYHRITGIGQRIGYLIKALARLCVPAVTQYPPPRQLPVHMPSVGQHDDLLPTRQLNACGIEFSVKPAHEMIFQGVGVGEPVPGHELPAYRRIAPGSAGNFVSADMHDGKFNPRCLVHPAEFTEDLADKTVGRGHGDIHHIVGVILRRTVDGSVARIGQQVFARPVRIGGDITCIAGIHRLDGCP